MANQPAFPTPPDLEGSFWIWDKLHCPRPLTPLEHELLLMSTGEGFTKAIGELGSPGIAVVRSINYYNYLSGQARDIGDEPIGERVARYQANVAELLPKVGDRWTNEWLPVILKQLEKSRAIDFTALSDDDLLRTFDEMHADVVYRWYVHGFLLYSFFSAGQFADFYREALSPENAQEGYEALQGFPSRAFDSTEGLWELSRIARSNPELRKLFEGAPPDEILAQLNTTEAGRGFVQQLNTYLDEFGWRADSVYELTRPAWREDPRIPLNAIQGYIGMADESSPLVQFEKAVKHREELVAAARSKLAADPGKLAQFEALYDSARTSTPIIEDHNHWIDQMGDILMRYPSLEIGRRLVAKGALAKADDVFLLHIAELKDAMAGADHKALAAQRRTEMDHWATVVPPPAIGVPPPPSGDPIEEVMSRFFGAPVEPHTDPAVISGIGASPGTARGPAKVVRSLAEASKLSPGDVLVCEMTLPPWTPLFSTASAVVADTGGILSHCAIVAREYRIPCVVGTSVGTVTIKDGMILTVDGSKGIVRIEAS